MTGNELIAKLQELTPEERELEVWAYDPFIDKYIRPTAPEVWVMNHSLLQRVILVDNDD